MRKMIPLFFSIENLIWDERDYVTYLQEILYRFCAKLDKKGVMLL